MHGSVPACSSILTSRWGACDGQLRGRPGHGGTLTPSSSHAIARRTHLLTNCLTLFLISACAEHMPVEFQETVIPQSRTPSEDAQLRQWLSLAGLKPEKRKEL